MIERSRKRSDWFRPSFENIGRHGNREREKEIEREEEIPEFRAVFGFSYV